MAQTGATEHPQVDQLWGEAFARRWEAAWNSHEHARLLELMTRPPQPLAPDDLTEAPIQISDSRLTRRDDARISSNPGASAVPGWPSQCGGCGSHVRRYASRLLVVRCKSAHAACRDARSY